MKNKDEILNIVDKFYEEYNLPPQNITDNEWESYLYVIKVHFLAHNIKDEYLNAMNIVIRRALNLVLIDDSNEFNINHLLAGLCDLSVFRIPHDEIVAMREEIINKIGEKKQMK